MPSGRCFDGDRAILSVMLLNRVFLSAALACGLALTPHLALAKTYRSLEVKHEFQRQHPCPSTGRTSGACQGYVKDQIGRASCRERGEIAEVAGSEKKRREKTDVDSSVA